MKAITMLATVAVLAAINLSAPVKSSQVNAAGTPLAFFLASKGADLNLTFTLEEDKRTDGNVMPLSPIETAMIPVRAAPIATEADLVSVLREALPADQIESDSKYPSVIHIIDRTLSSITAYPLDQSVPKFDYSGPVYQLPNKLGQKLTNNVSSPAILSTGDLLAVDFSSDAAVNTSSLTGRQILTEARHGRSLNSINWTASTSFVNGISKTFVYFNAASRAPNKLK